MKESSSLGLLLATALDRASRTPLHRQLYDALREAILSRRLRVGAQLPPTRLLAGELRLSRNTVLTAFEQLIAEGYITGKAGAGTFVAPELPDDLLRARPDATLAPPARNSSRRLSERGELLAATPSSVSDERPKPRAFQPGLCAVDEFPAELWARLASRRLRRFSRSSLDYGPIAGLWPLREAIAAHLRETRAARCEAAQVIIVSGSQQGLDLAARTLLDAGDAVWLEDPGYVGARGALLAAGARIAPVPVDEQGLNVVAGVARDNTARAVYVTPSHQFPLGVGMSLARRLELLEWAGRQGAWIIEDDYDSEYRYAGRPLASLQGLDPERRVIYAGTFSKVLFPALRVGYLVVPQDLTETFSNALAHTSNHVGHLQQMVLADFITEGHFARHIRRMRGIYAERQAALIAAVNAEMPELLSVRAEDVGMHLVGWLRQHEDDAAVWRKAMTHGVFAPPVSFYCLRERLAPGLLLGYTGLSVSEIQAGVRKLKAALTAT